MVQKTPERNFPWRFFRNVLQTVRPLATLWRQGEEEETSERRGFLLLCFDPVNLQNNPNKQHAPFPLVVVVVVLVVVGHSPLCNNTHWTCFFHRWAGERNKKSSSFYNSRLTLLTQINNQAPWTLWWEMMTSFWPLSCRCRFSLKWSRHFNKTGSTSGCSYSRRSQTNMYWNY